MDISEVLQFVDDAVYTKTGKRLNDLQRGVIEGILNQQKYSEIAKTYRRSQSHVKDVGCELLQLLSQVFEEHIDKKTLKSVLERQGNININFGNSIVMGYINICSQPTADTAEKAKPETPDFQGGKNHAQRGAIAKLRQFGLSDEQIAEVLGLPLDEVKQVKE